MPEPLDPNKPDPESIRAAMEHAWADHHHARNQTWEALKIEFALVGGIVATNWLISSLVASIVSCGLVLLVTASGVQITLQHRNRVELDKFRHIMNCEVALGLRKDNLIDNVQLPSTIRLLDVLKVQKKNTALFILRMHVSVGAFALLLMIGRLLKLF